MNLYPIFTLPDTEQADTAGTVFPVSLFFDFDVGDIRLDTKGGIAIAESWEAHLQWCQKALMTERGADAAYDDDFGVDYEACMHQIDRETTEQVLSQEIEEALKADLYDRTLDVETIQFEWNGDGLEVNLTIVSGIDGKAGELTYSYRRERWYGYS